MKIVRLKKGYSIRCSDAEYRLIGALVDEGIMGVVNLTNMDGLDPAEKAAYTRRTNQPGKDHFWTIDEDRRK